MSWYLQTPNSASSNLLKNILDRCGPAQRGGAAFAFASAQGVKLLAAEPIFSNFLKGAEFSVVVGLDAITDTRAVDELRRLSVSHPNFKPKLFLHSVNGSLFHPKTMWLKTAKGGVIITGSGNLTSGGLKTNWEAMSVETLTVVEMAAAEKRWEEWLTLHKKQLVDLDDPKAIEKAKLNKLVRTKIKIALKKTETDEDPAEEEVEAVQETVQDVENELLLNPVLIAEIPKSGNRWKQVNFDLKTYQEFFGVTKSATRHVRFYELLEDGSLGAPEDRQGVAVVSQNYRFEVGAAHGKPYPTKGHPIIVFEKVDDDTFNYVLLMPEDEAHATVQKYLDDTYKRINSNNKLRIQTTASTLKKVWPDAPFFK
ncbi:HKD family nuclease [Rhodoblastus acidophilus]|uniref:phospholipase D family protein n=1 Tax=Rhodoblastus acidophilus TaxID=1074 RepID=UPI0022259A4E|nr:phospholipase D family protein [Rhodoblastus acidophilus]MCW2317278.1 HKD family nuclease [Rhodoblastus acidophilus]